MLRSPFKTNDFETLPWIHAWNGYQEDRRKDICESPLSIRPLLEHVSVPSGKQIRGKTFFVCVFLCQKSLVRTPEILSKVARALEYLHLASLCHDDVLDQGTYRRGKVCLHHQHNAHKAILTGDFLLTQGLKLLTQVGHLPLISLFQEAMQNLILGQFQEETLEWPTLSEGCKQDFSPDEDRPSFLNAYWSLSDQKTGPLFLFASQAATRLSHTTSHKIRALDEFVLWLSRGFQMWDDMMDYGLVPEGSSYQLPTRELFQDYYQNKRTYPLLQAWNDGDRQTRTLLEEAMHTPNPCYLKNIQKTFERLNTGEQCVRWVQYCQRKAWGALQACWSAELLIQAGVQDILAWNAQKSLDSKDQVAS